MESLDRASKFTADYLAIIEERLNIKWNQDGDPVFLPSEINAFSLQRLRNELTALLADAAAGAAISDSRSFGKARIQTVGFGLVTDFDRLVKMGFLCGERVVLWDFLAGRILRKISDSESEKLFVGGIACNLLLLEPIVEEGGLVILPHPADWSDRTQHHLMELAKTPHYSAANQGLIAALSILDEIPLHPYTIFDGPAQEWPDHPTEHDNNRFFSREKYVLHQMIHDFFDDAKFEYLRDVRASEFFRIVAGKRDFSTQLQELIAPPAGMQSPQEIQAISRRNKQRLAELIDRRNIEIRRAAAEKYANHVAPVAAFGTVLNCALYGASLANVTTALATLSVAFARFFAHHWKDHPAESAIVQAFVELSGARKYREEGP